MTLPNLLIIGAAKSATTSLYQYLSQHPDVYMSPVKEPRYYACESAAPGVLAVRMREAYERLFDGATSEQVIGEASPQYLNDPAAAARISADLPGVNLIVSLRNPADRAYSSYLGRLAGGAERRGVDEAMRPGGDYFESSLYHAPLSRYFERFDRQRIKVVLFDDVVADARAVVRELCEFLGIERDFDFDTTAKHGSAAVPRFLAPNAVFWKVIRSLQTVVPAVRNTGLAVRAQQLWMRRPEPLPAYIRRRMLSAFAEDIAATEALIGRRLSHWLE